jgi:secreted Zn-dependent insulinase-like peptidase
VASLARIRFHQTSPGTVYSFAPAAAKSISVHGTAHCLSAGSRLSETGDSLPLEDTLEFCRRLVPQNCLIERSSKAAFEEMEALYPGDGDGEGAARSRACFEFGRQREQWYGLEYFVSPVDGEDVLRWETPADQVALHLPKPNRYIPRSLELCEDLPEEAKVQRIEIPVQPPELIVNTPDGESRYWTEVSQLDQVLILFSRCS